MIYVYNILILIFNYFAKYITLKGYSPMVLVKVYLNSKKERENSFITDDKEEKKVIV